MAKKKKVINDFERSSLIYFKEIGEFSPLSKEEEASLWEKYKKNNDLNARDKIIKSNLKFVTNVAKPYIGMGLSYSDLIAEGNYGLMKAMEKFDYTKGFKTISYSVWWIKQAIREAILERNCINGDDLPLDYEKSIDNESEDILPIEKNESAFLEEMDFNDNSDNLKMLLSCLNDREEYIVRQYYGINGTNDVTLEDIGNELNLTKERVRQILSKAITKLRSEALKSNAFV